MSAIFKNRLDKATSDGHPYGPSDPNLPPELLDDTPEDCLFDTDPET
jgi:hypothetical protein